ncbi:hypothetical protein [Aneurinibacillus terranovensis]|uniref:hypothetical protein n=1 Tax=Aneurinibacillus terranovensis TaxID=278991 RepID=UPI0004182D62|nr:hypothetical protein [Aneurinibacillus terranovensis]
MFFDERRANELKGRLYYENPYIKEFTAVIIEYGAEDDGQAYVVLNQTVFYPTGG